MLLVVMACVAGALLIALVSLSPSPVPLRVPRRPKVGLDRRQRQVQRRMRVTEALELHESRLALQRQAPGLVVATRRAPLPKDEWSRGPDPAVGVRRSFTLPMQPIAPYWQNWSPASPAGLAPPPPGYYYAPLPAPAVEPYLATAEAVAQAS
jgi:hypothetical protein